MINKANTEQKRRYIRRRTYGDKPKKDAEFGILRKIRDAHAEMLRARKEREELWR